MVCKKAYSLPCHESGDGRYLEDGLGPVEQPANLTTFLSSSLLEPFEAMVIITRALLALKGYSTLRIYDTFFGTHMCQALGQ